MSQLKPLVSRYRNDSSLHFKLWCAVSIGLIPAIITANILPIGGLMPGFGIEVINITYLPGWICGLVFLISAAICIVQRRYGLIVLLLPWLIMFFYGADELNLQLPSQWEVNERIAQDLKQAGEIAATPAPTTGDIEEDDTPKDPEISKFDVIRANLDQIVFANTPLLQLDRQALKNDLALIEEKLANATPDNENPAEATSVRLFSLRLKIALAEAQMQRTSQALRTSNVLSLFSLGLYDNRLEQKLRRSLKKVSEHRDQLISQRNALRVELEGINQAHASLAELQAIDAAVSSGLWASQTYQAWLVTLFFTSICFLALLLLAWKFTLGSRVYLLPVFGSVLVLTIYVDAPLVFRLWVIVKFVIVSLILRAAFLLYSENFPLLRRQTRDFLLRTSRQTLIYYLPFIILIILGGVTKDHLDQRFDDWLYGLAVMQKSVEAPDTNGKYIDNHAETTLKPDRDRHSRRENIDIAIDIHFKELEDKLQQKLTSLSTQAGLTTAQVARETVRFYEETIVETLPEVDAELDPPGCRGFLPWVFKTGQCAENAVLEPLNEEFTDTRNDQRDSLKQTTSLYADRVGSDAQKAIAIAREDLSGHMLTLKETIKTQLDYIYTVIDFFTWVSLLMLIMVIVKSFMYIFARIFFAGEEDEKRVIQFEPTAQPLQGGLIDEVSDTLTLTEDKGAYFYVNKAYDFANAPPDEFTPQASKAVFSRFKNGVWHLNRIRAAKSKDADDVPYRRIPDDERVVIWTLKPGDAVVFSWKTFVGMSDSIRIRAQYSWQLSSLVFGRMFYVVATVDADSPVDGTLLLVARGSDGIRETTSPSNSPDQLLAWQTTSRFQLRASLSLRNVYRSGIQIKAWDSDLAVMHLSDKTQKTGAAAFLKYFLMPV